MRYNFHFTSLVTRLDSNGLPARSFFIQTDTTFVVHRPDIILFHCFLHLYEFMASFRVFDGIVYCIRNTSLSLLSSMIGDASIPINCQTALPCTSKL
jgi:hypothetical protein